MSHQKFGSKIISRRATLKGLGAAAALGTGGSFFVDGVMAASLPQEELTQPPVAASTDGLLQTSVNAQIGNFKLGGEQTYLRCFDGMPVGKTLRVRAGDTLRMKYTNHLPFDPVEALCTAVPEAGDNLPRAFNVTNMHVHGVHVSPRSPADNIFLLLRSEDTYNYVYDIPKDHPPGTYFYHAHFHGSVALQVASGMTGALIIEGEMDDIPEIKAAKEQVMMFQTQRFDEKGECNDYDTLQVGDKVYINGQLNPIIRLKVGEVQRWRMINGSHSVNLDIKVGPTPFMALAFDGNPLPKATEVQTVNLVPGNRADVLFKGYIEGTYNLYGGSGYDPIATVIVEGKGPDMPVYSGDLPQPKSLRPIAESEVTYGRRLEFGMVYAEQQKPRFTINNQPFSCTETWKIPLGAVEEWEIYNHTQYSHPFHIHVNPFQVVSGGGVQPGIWLDTLNLLPFDRITFRTRFETYTGKFVFHCHNLLHEDRGMMQAVEVVQT
jgi:FtsP/CotA-like multicopper oxidase with cupredoxin domain